MKKNFSKQKLKNIVEPIIRETGLILLRYFNNTGTNRMYRKGLRDIVTEADYEAEKYIINKLNEYYPDTPIIAEEKDNSHIESNEYVWIIDPLDGTVNFYHGLHIFCISIGLVKNRQPYFGMIYIPFLNDLFYAHQNHGAYQNDKKINVSKTDNLMDSIVATGFPYNRNETEHNNLKNFQNVFFVTQGIRRLGSAAIDLCYVANGILDGFWELNLNPWDVAAGSLIVSEADGKVSTIDDKTKDYVFDRNIIATNGIIHTDLKSKLTI